MNAWKGVLVEHVAETNLDIIIDTRNVHEWR